MDRRSTPKRGKNEKIGKAQDIFFSERRKVLDLRPRRLGLKAGKREVLAFVEYAKRHKAAFFGCAAIIAVLLVAAIGRISYADNAHFYPTSCLGGWQNPSNAQGQRRT